MWSLFRHRVANIIQGRLEFDTRLPPEGSAGICLIGVEEGSWNWKRTAFRGAGAEAEVEEAAEGAGGRTAGAKG